MIGIRSVGVFLPERRLDNTGSARLAEFGVTEAFVSEKIGFKKVSRADGGKQASDLAVPAVKEALRRADLSTAHVDCMIFVTQNPDCHGLPHASAILHEKLGLAETCPVFDLSLGCSGWVHGLSILKAIMGSEGRECGLLVTSDPYSRVINEADKNTALLFGDGAAATVLTRDPIWRIGAFDLGTKSGSNAALRVGDGGKLQMNGREVFNFAALNVPPSIRRVLEAEGIGMDDVDRVLLHQGSKYIVDTIARRIGAPEKTPFVADGYGNTVSSSIAIALAENTEPEDNVLVVSGFGVGLAWATCVLRRVG